MSATPSRPPGVLVLFLAILLCFSGACVVAAIRSVIAPVPGDETGVALALGTLAYGPFLAAMALVARYPYSGRWRLALVAPALLYGLALGVCIIGAAWR